MSTKLTPHFTLEELTTTKTGLNNFPNEYCINNLRRLCHDILEPLREYLTEHVTHRDVSIIVNSAFRSPAVNQAVGGVKTSQHLLGQAADIHLKNTPALPLYNTISFLVLSGQFHVGQCILYTKHGFVHVSTPTKSHKDEFIIRNK